MKQKKLVVILAIVLVAVIAAFAGVYFATRPDTDTGSKTISVTVVHKDKSEKEFTIKTDAEYLSDALLEEDLILKEEHNGTGMYTVVDGEKADYSVDKGWWCVSVAGKMAQVGMDELALDDGDEYEITYTIS